MVVIISSEKTHTAPHQEPNWPERSQVSFLSEPKGKEKLFEGSWKPSVVVHSSNLRTREAEAGASLRYLLGSDFKRSITK